MMTMMEEHTITKTLFKLKHTYYRQEERWLRGGQFPGGPICATDL